MNFDIAIIGGGPAGYTAAERAGANGLKTVLYSACPVPPWIDLPYVLH